MCKKYNKFFNKFFNNYIYIHIYIYIYIYMNIPDLKNNKNNKNNKSNNNKSEKKVLTPKQAMKKRVGSYYHPTQGTYHTGVCKKGYELRESYVKKGYTRKNGVYINKTTVSASCVKNKGKPGKTANQYKVIPKLNPKNSLKEFDYSTNNNANKRFESLMKAIKKMSYRTVVLRLSAIRTLSKSNEAKYKIFNNDIKKLQDWRKKNPNLYK